MPFAPSRVRKPPRCEAYLSPRMFAVEDVLFVVTPLIEGATPPRPLTREQQLSVEETIRVGMPVAAALGHAHDREMWHGDLRPKRVRLTPERGLLAYFGLVDALLYYTFRPRRSSALRRRGSSSRR
jgi:hypothetical protein